MGEVRAAKQHTILVAQCGALRVGVPVDAVRRVVAAPLPASLPGAPPIVAGLLNLHGAPLVVVDLSRRGERARAAVTLESRIVIVETEEHRCGLLCESVEGTRSVDHNAWQAMDEIVPGTAYLAAGEPGAEGLILLHDPAAWLSTSEAHDFQAALERHLAEHVP